MKRYIVAFLCVCFFSCTSNSVIEKPKDLIPKDTMVILLTDVFIAKSAFSEKNLQNRRKVNYMPLVYQKYKIDSVRFMNSNLYYTSILEEYDLIYKEIEKILAQKKVELEKQLKIETESNKPDRVLKDHE